VGNQNSLIPAGDEECSACSSGQSYWPCDTEGLCWCWDTTKPKKPPAPASGLEMESDAKTPCDSYFTEAEFWDLAPNSTFPYTFDGFCKAVDDYNMHHSEKIFMMGSLEQRKAELAAFLGNTAHESDDFEAGREYLACGDKKEVDGKVYCKPCNNDLYDWENNICTVSMVDQNSPYNSYCQPSFEPPEGCVCETITQVAEEGELAGYVEASKVFYGRGAIQLSWNYNYIRASYALTGAPETFCQNPEMVATNELYAWGSGIFFWMESEKEGTTCHKEALKGDFGGTLNVINGGLECPAYHGGWHASAIKMRINRYCHAAALLGLNRISTMNGCRGMFESYDECLHDGSCPYCETFPRPGNETIFEGDYDGGAGYGDEAPEESVKTDSVEVQDGSMSNPTMMPLVVEKSSVVTSTPTIIQLISKPPLQQTTVSEQTLSPSSMTVTTNPTVTTLAPISVARLTHPPTFSLMSQSTQKSISPTTFSIVMAKPSLEKTTLTPTLKPIEESTPPPFVKEPTQAPLAKTTGEPTSSPLAKATDAPTPAPSIKTTDNPTREPSPKTTIEPTPNPSTHEPTPGLSESPTYSPSSPQPTMGPCDGDPCPNDWCRSNWGFCGEGSGYCTDTAIWSPSCRAESESPTFHPSDSPTSSAGSTFVKPNPGKKPPQGKKPVSGSDSETEPNGKYPESENDANENKSSKSPIISPIKQETQSPSKEPTNVPEPTPRPTEKVYSPSDPESSFYCGKSWADANKVCSKMCPSAKSEECGPGESCYAFTDCNKTKQPTESPIVSFKYGEPVEAVVIDSTNEPNPAESLETTINDTVSEEKPTNVPTMPNSMEGCNGDPCPLAGECRSQYGFCGSTFIYCNTLSSWTMEDCGLFGTDSNGATILCDADTSKCPDGKFVIRDPSINCEFFECPIEEESTLVLSGPTPLSRPTLPPIPKPTLPTLTNPKVTDVEEIDNMPIIGSQSNVIIPIGNDKPKKESQLVVVGDDNDEIVDDHDNKSPQDVDNDSNDGDGNADGGGYSPLHGPSGYSTDFFAEDWLKSWATRRISFRSLSLPAVTLVLAFRLAI